MKKKVLLFIATIVLAAFCCVGCADTGSDSVSVKFVVGETTNTVSVKKGETVQKPEDPVVEGKIFKGWFDSEEGGEQYDFGKTVDGDVTLYAGFADAVTVSFDTDGEITEAAIEKGTAATAPADPYKDGYKFIGWFTADDAEYDFSALVNADITLTAKFKLAYTVKFDVSPTAIKIPAQLVVASEKATAPETDIYRDGQYDFDYWADENDVRYDFDSPVTANITLHAVWKPYFLVTYKWADGYGTTIASKKVYEGGKAEDWRKVDDIQWVGIAYYWHVANVDNPNVAIPGEVGALYDFSQVVTENISLYTYQHVRTSWVFPIEATYDKTNPFKVETAGRPLDGSITYGEDYLRFTLNADPERNYVGQLEFCQMALVFDVNTMRDLELTYKNLGSDTHVRMFVYGTAPGDTALNLIGAYQYVDVLTANMSETDDWKTLRLPMPISDGYTIVFVRLEFVADAAAPVDNNGTDIMFASARFVS